MGVVSNLFLDIRDRLGDSESPYRWTDATLMRYLNIGLKDMVGILDFNEDYVFVKLIEGNQQYSVSGATTITRVEYMKKALPMVSHSKLDNNSEDWQTFTGSPEAIVYDKTDRSIFKVYPIYGDITLQVTSNSSYGVITSIEGVETVTMSYETIVGGDTGLLLDDYLKVYFTKEPNAVSALGDDTGVDSIYEPALIHFVVAQALRANREERDKQTAQEEMQEYYNKLTAYKTRLARSFTKSKLDNKYQGFV